MTTCSFGHLKIDIYQGMSNKVQKCGFTYNLQTCEQTIVLVVSHQLLTFKA